MSNKLVNEMSFEEAACIISKLKKSAYSANGEKDSSVSKALEAAEMALNICISVKSDIVNGKVSKEESDEPKV